MDLDAWNSMLGGMTGANAGQGGFPGFAQQPSEARNVYGMGLNGALPGINPQSNAPTYNTTGIADYFAGNRAGAMTMDPMLQAAIKNGNSGSLTRGVQAFLGNTYNPGHYEQNGAESTYVDNSQPLFGLAHDLGFNMSNYRPAANNQANDFWAMRGIADPQGGTSTNQLMNQLNDYTKDYYGVSGMSSGWDGGKNGYRGAASTLYKDNGQGQLQAASLPQMFKAKENSGFFKQEAGRELLTALSMVMPAFGGAAGLLGQGAAGTLSAGSGLGATSGLASAIGTGATNALVNAGSNYLLSGGRGGIGGILGSLGGAGLSAAGNSLMGNAGGLSDFFNTANAGSMGSVYNPMQGLNQMMSSTGLSNSPLGGLAGLFGGFGQNGISADTLRSLSGQMGGNYLAQRLDPRLGGLGSQAGRSLADFYNRT